MSRISDETVGMAGAQERFGAAGAFLEMQPDDRRPGAALRGGSDLAVHAQRQPHHGGRRQAQFEELPPRQFGREPAAVLMVIRFPGLEPIIVFVAGSPGRLSLLEAAVVAACLVLRSRHARLHCGQLPMIVVRGPKPELLDLVQAAAHRLHADRAGRAAQPFRTLHRAGRAGGDLVLGDCGHPLDAGRRR